VDPISCGYPWKRSVLANEGSISGILFQDQAGLKRTRLLTEWQKGWNDSEMGRYCHLIVLRVLVEAWMASAVDERVFLVTMTRLTSSHTGKTIDFLLSNNFIKDNPLDG
jgi:hypothetical protein